MQNLTTEQVHQMMLSAIDEIAEAAHQFPWEDKNHYANWLAQSFFYVQWTTRQLALASARSKPMTEDSLHWRFLEEAKEEKKHELLALKDLENLGFFPDDFTELPHTSFFYQTLSYLIENEHPIAILGYSLTLEGFAATRLVEIYPRIKQTYGPNTSSFLRLHCELDADHFANALPYLKSCPAEHLPLVAKAIAQCRAIYVGILKDIQADQARRSGLQKSQTEMSI